VERNRTNIAGMNIRPLDFLKNDFSDDFITQMKFLVTDKKIQSKYKFEIFGKNILNLHDACRERAVDNFL